ncbi:hypothetical protein [Streptomyces minutiscleroticus]|uniref:Uncharacterized protein n=1 Tax=Streptomyces minutiscleroticus TaxID=68238 RepID=A0A918U9H2_9ACTN|nr:hypothetical protein [Streptomyces minutiscleroticus]GGY11994.1 hypothetical protein GCM10010358_75500 [Streptomyces minutiscleroticus]
MPSKQVMTIAVLVVVFAWSTVMTVLGQLAAAAALLPSLGLLVQQIVAALNGTEARRNAATGTAPAAAAAGDQEPPR